MTESRYELLISLLLWVGLSPFLLTVLVTFLFSKTAELNRHDGITMFLCFNLCGLVEASKIVAGVEIRRHLLTHTQDNASVHICR